jgi:hypothetical protein
MFLFPLRCVAKRGLNFELENTRRFSSKANQEQNMFLLYCNTNNLSK